MKKILTLALLSVITNYAVPVCAEDRTAGDENFTIIERTKVTELGVIMAVIKPAIPAAPAVEDPGIGNEIDYYGPISLLMDKCGQGCRDENFYGRLKKLFESHLAGPVAKEDIVGRWLSGREASSFAKNDAYGALLAGFCRKPDYGPVLPVGKPMAFLDTDENPAHFDKLTGKTIEKIEAGMAKDGVDIVFGPGSASAAGVNNAGYPISMEFKKAGDFILAKSVIMYKGEIFNTFYTYYFKDVKPQE